MSREEIIAANPILHFVRSRGHELKPAGKNFVTDGCPVCKHKKRGHRPVTLYTETQSWSCHDCKRGGSVINWMMLEQNVNPNDAMRLLGGGCNTSAPAKSLVNTYDYTDESGELLFQTCRYQPKNFKQRRPDGKGGWIWNLEGVRRVLYNLAQVIGAQTVAITEGEKDCENLAKLGFVATTNPLGAGKWDDEYSEALRDKDVIVFGDLGDADGAGEKHTDQVIQSVIGKAKSIKRVALPDGFHDVSDYIATLPPESAADTIRKLIEKTPKIEPQSLGVAEAEPVELPPAPTPYTPPPLALLPPQLQEYVLASSETLNVDVSFILLPLLSSLGTAIGNSRSILLKPGFIQPPIIWTGIIGRSGSRKSPSLEAGCFAIMENERDLERQNKQAAEQYAEELAKWEGKDKKSRGAKPEAPVPLTCVMDKLTFEVLADKIEGNRRGLLIKKDELSHWFESFDQYHAAKGADVGQWLSLHTGVLFAFDRRTDTRSYRIWQPRVNIAGGIQPKVFRRILTPDYFERGLPARFLLAHPPFRQDRWSEATVPDNIRAAALNLFSELWLLRPGCDEHVQFRPTLLRLGGHAKAVFVEFYNDCGAASAEGSEQEEAAWCKLTGYAARFALVGQLGRDPQSKVATADTMQAACELARWFGKEAVRVYAELAETREQREQRELKEFIERRGGEVHEREVMQSFTRLKNDRDGTERELTKLVKAGIGKWESVDHGGGPGRPTRKFRLLRISTSTQFGVLRGKTGNSVDVDALNSQKIRSSGAANLEPCSNELAVKPAGLLEL